MPRPAFTLLCVPALCAGCAAVHAGWVPGEGPFDLVVPHDWAVVRNHRMFGNREVRLRAPDGRGALVVAWVRLDARSRSMPLDLLAETRALEQGRAVGFENTVSDLRWIALDDRPAVAVTGRSRWRPMRGERAPTAQDGDFSLVVTRTEDRALLVLLTGPVDGLDAYVADMAVFLDGFHTHARAGPQPLPGALDEVR